MSWYYFRDNTTQGPVELVELQRLHQEGTVGADTPVWTDGMADWTPYQQTAAVAGTPTLASAGSTAVATHACVECRRSFPENEMLEYEGKWICAACKPLFFQRLREGVAQPGQLAYASVGRRFLAIFLDGILLDIVIVVPFFLLGISAGASHRQPVLSPVLNVVVIVLGYVGPALYEILLIGKYGATLGKMAMGIKVVTPNGDRISYGRSTGRYFAKILSSLILLIGYLMAFWDPERRALHDRICETRVVSSRA